MTGSAYKKKAGASTKKLSLEEQQQVDIKHVKSGKLPPKFAERVIELENKLASQDHQNDDLIVQWISELMGLYSVSICLVNINRTL